MSTATTSKPPHVPHHAVARAIGRGSYGEIWLARSLTGAWRAVKIVDRRRFEDERAFEREFEGMAKFEPLSREHEGFVDILHVGRSDDDAFFYYVMELADDAVQRPIFDPAAYQPKTLKSELKRVARLPADEVITLGLSLTTALSALHRHGLVHRDIKPANIIFCGGVPKVADIGLVSAMGQQSFVGTEGYVPAEGPGTVQADLFSLGKVLYEIAMGKDRLEFPEVNTRLDELPDRALLMRLNEVLLRACCFDSKQRYVNAEEMHEDLVRVRDGRPLLGRPGRRRWWPLAAMLVVGVGAFAWWKTEPPIAAGKGSVVIETEPPGAQVRFEDLEGRWMQSPARLADVAAGEHVAHVMKVGYAAAHVKFTVAANGEARPPKLVLQRLVGAARIESKPDGCEFEVRDGDAVVKKGRTPADFTDLPTGTYEVVLRNEGREKRAPLVVERGEATPVKLEFGSRKFTITSTPQGAEIFADGKRVGVAPCEVTLIEGAHQLTARHRSWPEQTRAIQDDSPDGVAFAFSPGSVKITSAPQGAEIFAGEKSLGRTPLLLEELEPGEVRYVLKLEGYKPSEVSAVVEAGKQVFAAARFEARPGARRGEPWENSLGMKFVPVGEILVGIWPVRVRDYAVYSAETGRPRLPVDFAHDENHPIVRINWEDATVFCEWLTQHEFKAGKLDDGQLYRLPTDAEWSAAAGLPDEGGATPEKRDGVVRDFAWGKTWPPPPNVGNFADTAYKLAPGAGRTGNIPGYNDGFPRTSPVGTFPSNKLGVFDMTGNVWQWMADSYNGGTQRKDWGVLRGGSWATSKQEELRLGYRDVVDRTERDVIFGFRCVLVPER